MRTIAIIQARTNSTRLPNKVNLPLAGKTMVQNVYERVSRATKIDGVIVAWPEMYRCDENDLVRRFLLCAKEFQADRIIRVCADNPCVEPEEIDRVTESHSNISTLFSTAECIHGNYDGFGGELYTLEMFSWLDEHLAPHSHYREHPHKMWFDMDAYLYTGKRYPQGFRLDVNTQEDYEKLTDIYDHFGHNHFTVKEVIEYLATKHPNSSDPILSLRATQ